MNGLDERFNQTIQNMLCKFIQSNQSEWENYLDTCIFAYNTAVHESTRHSPYELMFGRKAVLPIDLEIANQDADGILLDCLNQQQEGIKIFKR